MKASIDRAIRQFSEFLTASWFIVEPSLLNRSYTTNESSIGDWLQANWELLVERKVLDINQYLEVYGAGADFNGASCRITDVNATPTHFIKAKGRASKVLDLLSSEFVSADNLIFDRLTCFQSGYYGEHPPFNHVIFLDDRVGEERVFAISDLIFELKLHPKFFK